MLKEIITLAGKKISDLLNKSVAVNDPVIILKRYGLSSVLDKQTKSLLISAWNLTISTGKEEFVINKIKDILQIVQKTGAKIYRTQNNDIVLEVNGIKNIIQTKEDIYILKEIYLDGAYNFNTREPMVFVDIGMNVGFASLFFAAQPNSLAVFGYEPFPSTYNQAKNNILQNEHISQKIYPHNFGIDKESHSIVLDYAYEHKGSMGIYGIPGRLNFKGQSQFVEIVLEKPQVIFEEINKNYPGAPVFIKLDCEGSEYNIIDGLLEQVGSQNILGLALEWHNNGPEELLRKLGNAGFVSFSFQPYDKFIGLICAIKSPIKSLEPFQQ